MIILWDAFSCCCSYCCCWAAALLFTLEHSVSLFFLLIFQFVCLTLIPPVKREGGKVHSFYLVQSWLQVAFLMRCRAANAFDPFQLGGVLSEHVCSHTSLHSTFHNTHSTIHTPLVHCASKINPWEAHSQLFFRALLVIFFYLFFHTIKCTKKLTESVAEAKAETVASWGGAMFVAVSSHNCSLQLPITRCSVHVVAGDY